MAEAVKDTSDLRIVLLGTKGVGKSTSGNTILGRNDFGSQSRGAPKCTEARGMVGKRRVRVIDTPDLLKEVPREVDTVISLSSPGPHLFLLVLHPKKMKENLDEVLATIREAFGAKAVDFTIVLFTHGDQEEEASFLASHKASKHLPMPLRKRHHMFNNENRGDRDQVRDLMAKIEGMVQEKGGFYNIPTTVPLVKPRAQDTRRENPDSKTMKSGRFSEILSKWTDTEKRSTKDCVRVVLIGKTGVGKSTTGNTILGRATFHSSVVMSSVTKKCEKSFSNIGSRVVCVIDTPGLFDTTIPNEQIKKEIGNCIALSSPGPHVFLLLMAIGRFTKEESDTLLMLQDIFGERAKAYTIIGFTRGEELRDERRSVEEYIRNGHPQVRELIQDCGGRYHLFCNKDKSAESQAMGFLQKIDKMVQANGGSYYTSSMFLDTEKEIQAKEMKLIKEKMADLEKKYEQALQRIEEGIERTHEKITIKDHQFVTEVSKISQTIECNLSVKRDIYNFPHVKNEPEEETPEMAATEDNEQLNMEEGYQKKVKELQDKLALELQETYEKIRSQAEQDQAVETAEKVNTKRSCAIL